MSVDLLASIDWIWLYLIPFMLVLTVIVFAHELGHYLAAKYNGVKVEVFSIGFGPEIFGFNDKSGTRWKFSWIPLGGYVRMYSDADAASRPDKEQINKMSEAEKQQSHFHKTVWQRVQISVAGPLANFLFSIIVFTILYSTVGIPVDKGRIKLLDPEGPAAIAGLKDGDKIIAIEGQTVSNFPAMLKVIQNNPDKPLNFKVMSDNEQKEIIIIPRPKDLVKGKKNGAIGIKPNPEAVIHSFPECIIESIKYTARSCVATLAGIGDMIMRRTSSDGLMGPVGIAQLTGEIATQGISTILFFMAILSLNLGLINLFPIPMLDGGHLLFYLVEAIKGKPLSEKAQEVGFTIGMVFVGVLMLFSTWNDLAKFSWVQKLIALF